MFDEQYRKMNQKIQPSPALNEETAALMREARDHGAALPPKKAVWKAAILIPAASVAAAVLVAAVLLSFWLNRGETIQEATGNPDNVIYGESEPDTESEDGSTAPPEEDPLPTDPENTAPPEEDLPEAPGEDDGTPAPGTDTPEEDPEDTPEGDEGKPGSTAPSTGSSDPYGPDVIHDDTTTTYLSIRAFLNALAKKETPGYGRNYYNARELILVPSKLPNQARFRHLHLENASGKYSYSYLFSANGKEYILDVQVDAKAPKTLQELTIQKKLLSGEKVQTGQKGDQLFFLFGENDYITVTVTEPKSTVLLNEEQVTALLSQFELERCGITNTLIDMVY